MVVRKGRKPKGSQGGKAGGTKAPTASGSSASRAPPKKGGAKDGKGKGTTASSKGNKTAAPKPRKIRPPKQAAILISVAPAKEGEEGVATPNTVSLGEAVAGVKGSIKLSDFDIASLKPKRAAAGGILYEVPGQESGIKADKLAEALKALLEPKGLRVTRPVKYVKIRVSGLDESAIPTEVQSALAVAGGCVAGKILVGKPNRFPAGRLGALWAKLPAVAAKKVIDAVEALGARPFQCYKCLAAGHTRATCKAEVDRSGFCYRCDRAGHRAAECSAEPRCPYCADRGLKAEHRYGGRACASLRPEKKRKGGDKNRPLPQSKALGEAAAPPTLERSTNAAPVDPGPENSREEAMETE